MYICVFGTGVGIDFCFSLPFYQSFVCILYKCFSMYICILQEAIYKKYGIPRDRLRAYIHYQPSYYHLHVHFTQLKYAAPKSSVGEAHLLHDVIDNIETIDPMYYQKRRLSFTVSESCLLWKAYQEHYNCSSSSSSGSGGPSMANTS